MKETIEFEKENPLKKVLAISERVANKYKIMKAAIYAKRFHFLTDSDDGNNMAYMAMIKRMKQEQLTAGCIQHSSKIFAVKFPDFLTLRTRFILRRKELICVH